MSKQWFAFVSEMCCCDVARTHENKDSMEKLEHRADGDWIGRSLCNHCALPQYVGCFCSLFLVHRVSITPGNLLEFNWSSWKFLCKMSKIDRIRHQMFFQVPDAPKPFFMRLRPRPLWRSLWRSSKFLFGWGELKYSYYEYFSSPKEAEARQTCPGFFLKSLLESPRNLLEICLIKFVDTLVQCHHIHLLYREVPTQCFALFKRTTLSVFGFCCSKITCHYFLEKFFI